MDTERCAKCGREVLVDELVNYLCDDCWSSSLIKIVDGIPQLNDSAIAKEKPVFAKIEAKIKSQ